MTPVTATGASDWVAMALLIGALVGLGFAGAVFGVDSRDGRDW